MSHKYLKFLFFFIIAHLSAPYITANSTSYNTRAAFNILIINSYDTQNEWETLILNGLTQKLHQYNNVEFKIEFLDSKTLSTSEYTQTFLSLLNIKYEHSKIDAILAVDDEAFTFVRNNILNSNSIFYKIPTVFIGVNSSVELTTDEQNYITGVIEYEDNLRLLNIMIDLHKNLSNVYFLLDTSIFSNIVKENLLIVKSLTQKPLNINFIQQEYIDDILKDLNLIDDTTSSIVLVGDFKYIDTNKTLMLKDTIKLLQNNSNTPIYSKIQPYIYAGAIGGVVDWGEYHGNVAGEIIIKLIGGSTILDLQPIHNSLDLTIFNYDSLNHYKINPLLLPKESIIINRGFFDFLLPYPIKIIFWLLLSIIPFALILLLIFHIKNKRKQALKDMLYDKAIESEKFKTDFITTMSHEFRTPINIILSTSHLLDYKLKDNTLNNEYLNNKLIYISQNSKRLLKLVNNIIDITKLDSGFLEPIFKNNNVVEIVEDTVLSVVDFANTHNISIIFDTDNEEIITAIDKILIERCILNLLSNAIKFTPKGGSIYVTMTEDTNMVIIKIKDTGIGIPEEQLPHIFERFYQVDVTLTRANEGSGLGLYIVKKLITLHNGNITVDSIKNLGTTFTITLPITLIPNTSIDNNIKGDNLSELVNIELSDIPDKE